MAVRKIDDKEFQRDMNKYLDKASKSSTRFINLHEKGKKNQKQPEDEEKTTILIKEKTPFEHFLSNISKFFSSPKKKEEIDEDGEDVTEELEEDKEEVLEEKDTYEETEEVEEKPERKSFFAWLFGKKEIEEVEEIEETSEDMRQLAILTKDLLKKISHDEFTKLKAEGRIDQFKEILKRNNLIK